jgi:hypothetical protein
MPHLPQDRAGMPPGLLIGRKPGCRSFEKSYGSPVFLFGVLEKKEVMKKRPREFEVFFI